MKKSEFKKLSYESKFSRRYACWCNNHSGAAKYKKANRRIARVKLKQSLNKEVRAQNE